MGVVFRPLEVALIRECDMAALEAIREPEKPKSKRLNPEEFSKVMKQLK